MCGIAGVLSGRERAAFPPGLIEQMLLMIQHRGPDEFGVYQNHQVAMGSVRLSIIDLSTGQQPIANEEGTVWIVFNGEIFNYVELMAELKHKGHTFRTTSDTEVIVHLYEEYGVECLQKLNGQFAFAIWDGRRQQLFIARDRVGIRPLFYTQTSAGLVFGSEIKSILVHPAVMPRLDPIALDQIFTFWSTLSPRTVFEGIYELPPGHYLLADAEGMQIAPYWELTFPPVDQIPQRSFDDALQEFDALFEDSVRLRLRADVPVAAYLSGGLDSCTTTDYVLRCTNSDLQTFSISFADPNFDETHYQRQAVEHFGTQHHSITCDASDIARAFEDVIWHTETPILRTAPAPLFLLSELVREHGIKVVVTGEGADETLAGYNIFKEALVRRFWAREPDSKFRPLLLGRLYPYIPQLSTGRTGVLRMFFSYKLEETGDPFYSHLLRWHNTTRIKQYLSGEMRQGAQAYDSMAEARARYSTGLEGISPLAQAQYLETRIFLSSYLLSSQGDRMAMAHSVEGRYPFLDHRLVEFAASLPAAFKMRGLTEKYLLKRLMRDRLPDTVVKRVKQPYRAPISDLLLGEQSAAGFVQEMLAEDTLRGYGIFEPSAVTRLIQQAQRGKALSETEQMAVVGILSAQLVHHLFVDTFSQRVPPPERIHHIYQESAGKKVIDS
ncbi:MAG: asparagine synthase (glutamine-hydrolyzing) [Anaerolineae bacterium]|nr:asparagine synthase (glutamine-hydrolyzing) [Anaerolineae bacterium]